MLCIVVYSCKNHNEEVDEAFVFNMLTTSDKTSYDYPKEGGTDSIFIHANCLWTVEVTQGWVHTDKQSHEGDGMLTFTIDENKTPVTRYAEITISSPQRQQIIKINIKQQGASKLYTYSSYDQAVGYSYDMTADYPEGVRYAVFDIANLDYMQYMTGNNYIVDDDQLEMTEEVYTAHSETELQDKVNATIGVGVKYNGISVDVKASVDYKTLETKNREYALKKVRRTVFMRNLQYLNVLADAKSGVTGLFTPAFEADWKALMEAETNSPGSIPVKVERFLDKWGKCFVSTSMMGASLEYEVEVESSVLTKEFDIKVAVDASLASVVNIDVSGYYSTKLTQMNSHYNKRMVVRGGDARIMSILNTQGNITKDMYQKWQESVRWKNGVMSDDAVLSDVKLVSFAELFTGRVKTEMASQIKNMK